MMPYEWARSHYEHGFDAPCVSGGVTDLNYLFQRSGCNGKKGRFSRRRHAGKHEQSDETGAADAAPDG